MNKDEINKLLSAALGTLGRMQIYGHQARDITTVQALIDNAMQKLNEQEKEAENDG